ncbi:MAG: NAD(P)H-binding protein [Micrococcaceae bacterium]
MKIAVAGGTGVVGKYVVELANAAGYEVLSLSRSQGVDLTNDTNINLSGVDAVIDVSGTKTISSQKAKTFFEKTTSNLLKAEAAAGVKHHIALSIVGASKAPYGYYAGKALQEELVAKGEIPWSILCTTQFFEFAEQNLVNIGNFKIIPKMVSQPIAAQTVAKQLLKLVEAGPQRDIATIAGLEQMKMAKVLDSIAKVKAKSFKIIEMPLPNRFGKALFDGSILPDQETVLIRPALDEWLRIKK